MLIKKTCWYWVGVGIILLGLSSIQPSWAEPIAAKKYSGVYSFQFENDSMVGTDKHYSSGVMLSYFPLKPAPEWISKGLDQLDWGRSPDKLAVEYFIGNSIFTPKNIASTAPQPHDRPWVGHTYASFSVMRRPEQDSSSWWKFGDKLDIEIGLVGPASGSELFQTELHRVIGSTQPRGWDNQIGNEVTLNLRYFRKWLNYYDFSEDLELEVSPVASVALGSPYTYASLGLVVRLGPYLRKDYGPTSVLPNYPGSSYFIPGTPWNWYAMAGVDYRYVYYNLFLDGPLFRAGPSIDKHTSVGDFFVGAAASYKKYRVALTINSRTNEYKGQKGMDSFGTLNLSYYH